MSMTDWRCLPVGSRSGGAPKRSRDGLQVKPTSATRLDGNAERHPTESPADSSNRLRTPLRRDAPTTDALLVGAETEMVCNFGSRKGGGFSPTETDRWVMRAISAETQRHPTRPST